MMMTKSPSSQYLTHLHAGFHGCTAGECYGISLITLIVSACLSGLITLSLGWGSHGLLLNLLVVFIADCVFIRYGLIPLFGRFKRGKPTGFVRQQCYAILHRHLGLTVVYLTREGCWSTRRHV